MPTGTDAPAYFPAIDVLRGFAALSVVMYHLVALASLPIPTWYPVAWFRIGQFGVDLFFAISGAVILISTKALIQRHAAGWKREFVWRRVARIVPLYLLTCLVFVVLIKPALVDPDDWWFQVFTHLLFVHNFWPGTHGSINGVNWTLAVEMQFYATALLLGLSLLRAPLWRIVVTALLIGAAWRIGCWWLLVNADPGQPELMFHASTQLPGLAEEFTAGIIAARWRLAMAKRGKQPGQRLVWLLGITALLAWSATIAWLHQIAAGFWTSLLALLSVRPMLAIATGLSVAWALVVPARRFTGWTVKTLGQLSYGIYLWHLIVLLAVQQWLKPDSPWTTAGLVVGLTLLLSWIGYQILERPLIRLTRKRLAAKVA